MSALLHLLIIKPTPYCSLLLCSMEPCMSSEGHVAGLKLTRIQNSGINTVILNISSLTYAVITD